MNNHDKIASYLKRFGLTPAAIEVYVTLLNHGTQSVVQLARAAAIERTKVYRSLDELRTHGLVESEERYKRQLLRAAPLANLSVALTRKENELKALQSELPALSPLTMPALLSTSHVRVQVYEGSKGIRQALWNELRARTEIVGYNYRILEEAAGKKYTENWAEEFARRHLSSRLVVGDDFVTSWREGQRQHTGTSQKVPGIQYHYLPNVVFPITHSCDIYDDTVTYFQWHSNEIIAVEIHNQQIADAQRRFFETLWTASKPEERI